MSARSSVRQHAIKLIVLLWGFLIGVISPSTAEPGQVRIYLEKGSLTLTSVEVRGSEYLSLTNVRSEERRVGKECRL